MIALTTTKGLVTTVEVASDERTLTSDLRVTGRGVARCKADDFYARTTGERIALGRAIQDFGRQVEAAGLAESVSLADIDRAFVALVLASLS
jgi:hypothetical protein